jgi:uncharacterized protein (DUF1330 family)
MMKRIVLPLTAFAGVAIGAVGARAGAEGPSAGRAPGFYVGEVEITDSEGIKPYSARVESTLQPFGGRFIVRGGKVVPLEGEAPKGRIVVIAFDSFEKAQAWYDSAAYRELRPIRQKAAKSRVFIVEGTNPR